MLIKIDPTPIMGKGGPTPVTNKKDETSVANKLAQTLVSNQLERASVTIEPRKNLTTTMEKTTAANKPTNALKNNWYL